MLTTSAQADRGRRRLRTNPLRMGVFVTILVALAAVALGVPGWPYVAVSLPAADPLGGVGESRADVTVSSPGTFLAGAVRADGAFVGAMIGAGEGLEFLTVWPDGRTARSGSVASSAALPEPSIVVAAEDFCYAWVPAPADAAPGGTVYAVPTSGLGIDRGDALRPQWQVELSRTVVRIGVTPVGLALAVADSSGIPSGLLLLDLGDGTLLREEAAVGGLWTSWAVADAAGGIALAGAQIVNGRLTPTVVVRGGEGDLLYEVGPAEGAPYLVSVSPTGRYLLGVTHRRLYLWTSDGTRQWSRPFPAVSVAGAAVGADGRVILATRQNILVLDGAGRTTRRWRGPALATGRVSGGGLLILLNNGAVLLTAEGTREAAFRWEGETQVLAVDHGSGRVWRAGQGMVEMFCFSQE